MRFHWLLLSFLSIILFCSPAEAGRLLFWRFESNQNRLVFTTDAGVQPTAQLIFNPTRVVIDLPGTTLGRPSVNQPVGGLIRSVRVGQFDSYTTRLVIELAPGYTVDPQQVNIRGTSPTQWTVQLPKPQRVPDQPRQPLNPGSNNPPPSNNQTTTGTANSGSQDLQVTRNGIVVNLANQKRGKISVKRSRDRRRIEFKLEGATLTSTLAARKVSLNNFGISEMEFEQTSTSPPVARIVLNVDRDSPDWLATFTRSGGIVLFPKGGMSQVDGGNSVRGPINPISTNPEPRKATIQSLQLSDDNNYLLINADANISGRGNWNNQAGVYELRIANAQLANSVKGPQLNRNSPIFRLRLRQEGEDTVVVLVQPTLSIQVASPQQLNNNSIALPLQRRFGSVLPPAAATSSPSSLAIRVTPPPRTSWTPTPQPTARPPSTSLPRPNKRVLVVIDPGHGGKDPGTIGIGGVQEKNIILPISQQVAQLLQRQGVQVRMTRNSDYFVSLAGRTQMANRIGANLFVSIHANAINLSRPDVNGLETYYYASGQRLAQTIHRSILRSVNIRDRRVRRARFYVLRNSRMPSVLVETGFLTGNEDSRRLQNPAHRSRMAEAIARGILEYIQQNRI